MPSSNWAQHDLWRVETQRWVLAILPHTVCGPSGPACKAAPFRAAVLNSTRTSCLLDQSPLPPKVWSSISQSASQGTQVHRQEGVIGRVISRESCVCSNPPSAPARAGIRMGCSKGTHLVPLYLHVRGLSGYVTGAFLPSVHNTAMLWFTQVGVNLGTSLFLCHGHPV